MPLRHLLACALLLLASCASRGGYRLSLRGSGVPAAENREVAYFDAIERLVAEVPKGTLFVEFDLNRITPVGEVLKMLPRFLFKKLLGRA